MSKTTIEALRELREMAARLRDEFNMPGTAVRIEESALVLETALGSGGRSIDDRRARVAIKAAISHIGPRRPDPEDDPEDAEMWDGLQDALAALGRTEGEVAAHRWHHPNGEVSKWNDGPSDADEADAAVRLGCRLENAYTTPQPEAHEAHLLDAGKVEIWRPGDGARSMPEVRLDYNTPQPEAQAVAVETVGFVRTDRLGDLCIDWTLEGGISALEVGEELLIACTKITDDDGGGEVFTRPTHDGGEERILSVFNRAELAHSASLLSYFRDSEGEDMADGLAEAFRVATRVLFALAQPAAKEKGHE